MVAVHILHMLLLSAAIHEDGIMELCVLVFDSSGEPVNRSEGWYVVFRTVPEPNL